MEISVGTVKEAKGAIKHIEALGLEVTGKMASGTWNRPDKGVQEEGLKDLRILRWGRNAVVATIDSAWGSERLRETANSAITITYQEPAETAFGAFAEGEEADDVRPK